MKILHSADWHLDSPLQGFSPRQAELLRQEALALPAAIARLCKQSQCDLMLLSGDLFDGACTRQSLQAVRSALEEAAVPVFISPGNHDPIGAGSPWLTEVWPENVHIFTHPAIESVVLENLDCRVYGAGYTGMDCPGLLSGFQAQCPERYRIGVLHADPTSVTSPYSPITKAQVQASNLSYLALGHIHKSDSFTAGNTLCAWPGCPMGRGFDELGAKGVLIVTVEDHCKAEFVPLHTPQFFDLTADATDNPEYVLSTLLPPVANADFYRITLTGAWQKPDLQSLYRHYGDFPNLLLREETTEPVDPWATAGEDSFEGTYFRLLKENLSDPDSHNQEITQLAARISRQLLDGQEVTLP